MKDFRVFVEKPIGKSLTLFYVFSATRWGGGEVANAFTLLRKHFFDIKKFLEIIFPIHNTIFTYKILGLIINGKNEFFHKMNLFFVKNFKMKLSMVNPLFFEVVFL